MRRDYRKNKLFNRRAVVIGGIRSSLTAILIARLGYLQLIKYDEYATQSDSNRIKPLIIPAPRGIIVDRNGKALVSNEKNYRLLLYLESRSDVTATVNKLVKILDIDEEAKEDILKRVSNIRKRTIISLIDKLNWGDLARIEASSYKLPGISIESESVRNYPFPFETAHFVGYVSSPSEKEAAKNNKNSLFMHPNFRVGKNGVEKTLDGYLRGKFSIKYAEVDAFGLPIRTLHTKHGVKGGDLNLTVDLRLQEYVVEKVKDKVASVVVMNVKTGEIISIVSNPSFNANNFVEGVTQEYWDQLIDDERKPLNNRPVSALYPPGSTFKMMVALAALENGINPKKYINCTGKYRLGKRTFHCWKKHGHGRVNMSDAISKSCNVYFFNMAYSLGIDDITQMAKRFGFGERFDINLPGVKAGNMPSDKWKRELIKEPWVKGDTLNSAIGQGFVLTTPLQMAVATARIANGGVPIKPHLVKSEEAFTQYDELKDKLLVKEDHLKLISRGMERVVNDSKGTAYYRRIRKKNFEMAGKTGTSQVISKREDEMTKEEKEKNKNHAIFVGFAPISNPKYSISVVVEHGGSGSASAAPIARDVLLKAQKLS